MVEDIRQQAKVSIKLDREKHSCVYRDKLENVLDKRYISKYDNKNQ